jgi:Pyruvate/2-oxoacid:ferredoxin oxidoreductase gamma subunit
MKNRKDNMTIKQMIKQAEKVYAWVNIHDEDGAYIQVKKADLLTVLNLHAYTRSRFDLREDGILYID